MQSTVVSTHLWVLVSLVVLCSPLVGSRQVMVSEVPFHTFECRIFARTTYTSSPMCACTVTTANIHNSRFQKETHVDWIRVKPVAQTQHDSMRGHDLCALQTTSRYPVDSTQFWCIHKPRYIFGGEKTWKWNSESQGPGTFNHMRCCIFFIHMAWSIKP